MAKVKRSAKKSAKKPAPKKVLAKKVQTKKIAKNTASKKNVVSKVTKSKSMAPKATFGKFNLQPLADRIAVELEGPSDRTAGGLYIPGTVSERPNKGTVVAVGPGGKNKRGHLRPLDVKKGDSVLFSTYAGVPTIIDNKEVLILQESDVLGVISK